jgi:hypothetical protein
VTWFTAGANETAADAVHVEKVTFVSMDFPSGFLRAHTRIGTLTWGGYDWVGVGNFGNVSEIPEDAMLRPNGVTISLSGVDAGIVTAAVFEAYHGRAVNVYTGFLNVATLALVADPQLEFRGLMDTMTVELGAETGSITVQCEGELARWQRHSGRLFTHESQQEIFPGDRGFDQVPFIQNRTVSWVKKSLWGTVAQAGSRRTR